MKKDKILIGLDTASKEEDFNSATIFKISKDKSVNMIESITTQNSKEFKKMKNKMKEKYLHAQIIEETNQFSLVLPKKSRKTKDIKSFKSSDYEMFKNGFFNCDNIPYGYNFLIGRCMEPVTFEPKRKEK